MATSRSLKLTPRRTITQNPFNLGISTLGAVIIATWIGSAVNSQPIPRPATTLTTGLVAAAIMALAYIYL